MNEVPKITLRIPGAWADPGELLSGLPEGVRMNPERLRLADGTEFEFNPLPPDGKFPQIFQSACRRPASREELDIVNRYTVNVALTGDGGSLDAAHAVMRAGAAIVQAGGAGVFIDNSAMAHGGSDWLAMTEDGSSDAISFAFATIVRGPQDVYTMGMQAMGFPDLLMHTADLDEHGEMIVELIRYVCGGDKPIDVGHVLADDLARPRFQIVARDQDRFEPGTPLHNPYGRLRILSVKEIAEGN